MIPLPRIPALEGLAVSQIGILVRDLEDAVARYDALWRPGRWRGYRYAPDTVPELRYQGDPGRFAVLIALTDTVPQLELIQPLAGPSIYDDHLEAKGEGLHHLGLWVDSVDELAARMGEAGYRVTQSGAGYGAEGDGAFAYFDTDRDLGVILEAIEIPRVRREPDRIWGAPRAAA